MKPLLISKTVYACARRCLAPVSLLILLLSGPAHADRQLDPALQEVVAKAVAAATTCFPDKYDAEVWYKLMEPRLRRFIKSADERLEILRHVYCESRARELPAELVLAVIDVESSFNHWAVSTAGAQGLMQVMPFWPEKLGMKRHQLMQIEANIRMGCAILRHYYDREKRDVRKALARYNGSIGRRDYPDLVITRWTTRWKS